MSASAEQNVEHYIGNKIIWVAMIYHCTKLGTRKPAVELSVPGIEPHTSIQTVDSVDMYVSRHTATGVGAFTNYSWPGPCPECHNCLVGRLIRFINTITAITPDRSQIQVHADERTNVYSVRSSLVVTRSSTNPGRSSLVENITKVMWNSWDDEQRLAYSQDDRHAYYWIFIMNIGVPLRALAAVWWPIRTRSSL